MSGVVQTIFVAFASTVYSGVIHAPAIFNGKWWHGLLGSILFATFAYGLMATLLALPYFAASWIASVIALIILVLIYGPFALYWARLHFNDMNKGFARIVMVIALFIHFAFTTLMFISLGLNLLAPLWIIISVYVGLGLSFITLLIYVVLNFLYPCAIPKACLE